MDGTGVRGILSIYDDMDSVVAMVQVSTELTTHRKNNGFMGNFKHGCKFYSCAFFCNFPGAGNPCTERTAEKEEPLIQGRIRGLLLLGKNKF